jgi:hypothetical protein
MGDPASAGQWYFLIDSQDEHAAATIARFESSRGSNPFQLWTALPSWARNLPLETYPPAARERLARVMPGYMKPRPPLAQAKSAITGTLVSVGCIAVVVIAVALLVLGAITAVRWVV